MRVARVVGSTISLSAFLCKANMSAASTTTPPVVRSSSRRQPSYNAPSTDRPQRTFSNATRQPSSPVAPDRANAQSQSLSQSNARPVSMSQQASLAGVARRDYEATNVARPPSNRRSSSHDRSYAAPPPKRTESSKDTRRTSARPGSHSRNNSHMSATGDAGPPGPSGAAQTPSGAKSRADAAAHVSAGSTRKRTEIDAQTGKWSLGKTIGAGSMGKVKLAKNLESGEQVRIAQATSSSIFNFVQTSSYIRRSRSRSYLEGRRTNTTTIARESAQSTQRKSGLRAKLRS